MVCPERIDTDLVRDKLIFYIVHMTDLVLAALRRDAVYEVQGECCGNDPKDKYKPDHFRKSPFLVERRSTASHVQIIPLWLGL